MKSIKLRFSPIRLLFASLAFAGLRLPAAGSTDGDGPQASSRAASRCCSPTSQQLFQLQVGAPAARQALLLAIDERAFPFRDNLALFVTKPAVRAEPVLEPSTSPDAPDNVGVACYGTVLHEGALFRLWYYSLYAAAPNGGLNAGPVCYAESADGEHWVRPNLGQLEWHGSRNNNAIALG